MGPGEAALGAPQSRRRKSRDGQRLNKLIALDAALFIGTIFLPNQTVSFSTNQAMEDIGQVYCGDWLVQSGNHPNPVVTHDNGGSAFQAETLRLAE
jgi:hypothetical protein